MSAWLRRLPTRWQITLLHAVILTLVLGGVGEAVLRQQRSFLFKSTTEQLSRQTQQATDAWLASLASVLGSSKESGNSLESSEVLPADVAAKFLGGVNGLLDQLVSANTAAVALDPDGRVLASSAKGATAPVPNATNLAEARQAEGNTTFRATVDGESVVAVLVPLRGNDNKDVLGFVETSISLQPMNDALNRLRDYFIAGGVLAIALSTALGLRATRHVLRPLEHLVRVTRRIAAGDLSQRVGLPPGRNEIAQVGASFDAMVAQLETSFAAQRRFVADAAHELRTPLTALSASTELLLIGADESDPAKTQRLLRYLDTELTRLTRLTNDLLTLSALDARRPVALKPLDLGALFAEVGEQSRTLLRGQELQIDIAPGLWVNGDADRLRQVVLNLLDNARKYTPSGGRITLQAMTQPDEVSLTVEDTGIGIPPDALAQIFERFYRVDTARTRQTGGSGLGLAIVDALVRAHGGRVAIESEPNVGTRVVIALPRLASQKPSPNLLGT